MSRSIASLACVLAIAAVVAGCPTVQEPGLSGFDLLKHGRFTAADGTWSIATPAFAGPYPWVDEQRREGETSVVFGTPYSSTQCIVEVSPVIGDVLSIPAEASRVILDQMQDSLAAKQASVHVLEETESREVGRGVVSRVWVEEVPVKLPLWRTGIRRVVRVVQVETRGDRFVVFTLAINDGREYVERDHALRLAEHTKAWREFIGSFRFEETSAAPSPAPTPP